MCLFCSRQMHGAVTLGVGTCRRCVVARAWTRAMADEPVPEPTVPEHESRDGKGAGDHDTLYGWGHPRSGLTLLQQARLTIMRGLVKDHTGAIVGDSDWVAATPAGLYVPIGDYWKE